MFIRRKQWGYSLVEILIAMAVIAIGMAGVAATLIFGSQKAKHGDKLGTATHHARILVETCIGQNLIDLANPKGGDGLPDNTTGLNDLPTDPFRPLDDPPFFENGFMVDRAEDLDAFKRKITLQRKGAIGTIEDALVVMTVTVQWEDKGVKRDVKLTSIVPVQDP
jgi:prepilin-type N-terminal cleavage/methylation domain-containing protein